MNAEEREQLAALEADATATPWRLRAYKSRGWTPEAVTLYGKYGYLVRPDSHGGMFNDNADARLVVAARNALPALLADSAEAERLREVVARVEALFSGGPDTVCRTVWRDTDFSGADPIECVEVPVDGLRAALDPEEAT